MRLFDDKDVLNQISESLQLINERLVVINNDKKYGQVIFMAGGSASGKGFAIKNFISSASYKVRDVDEMKTMYLKFNALTKRYPELDDIDLKRPADVAKLHAFVKEKGIKDKTFDLLLSGKSQETLPNIIFDITAKDKEDITDVIPRLIGVGYKPENIHLVWVLANYASAVKSNRERARTVPDDVILGAHEGAAKTVMSFVRRGLPHGLNGEFVVINANRDATQFLPGSGRKGKFEGGAPVVAKMDYVRLKKPGRPYAPSKDSLERVVSLARENVPLTVAAHKDIDRESYDRRRSRRKHG